ncbi:MAG TPA: cupin domain-containing protein [Dehalococcoidia bacterium]|jgi:quercetin dioxygenase-like cupin family protein|nr:cupin domain-containing protein [Dehalococcoidia bacterium]
MATSGARTYLKTHKLRGKELRFNLREEQEPLLERAMAAAAGRTAKTLVKEGPLRVTLVALRKGAKMSRHHVDGQASMHVLRGRVQFAHEDGTTDLRAGGVLVLDSGVEHEVRALADSAFLITMSWLGETSSQRRAAGRKRK